MVANIFQRIFRLLILLMVTLLVLLATYVSAGRLLMPAVSNYASFVEEQIFNLTGLPASIESLTGDFDVFNPSLRINGLQLLVGRGQNQSLFEDTSALIFDSATIIVDIPRSLREGRWVLAGFVVETLEVNIEQTEQDNWQLAGIDLANHRETTLETLFDAFQRVSTLNLHQVVINIETNLGNTFTLENGSATIENLGESHLLHINANLEQSSDQVAFSFEVEGDEISEIDGQIYIDIPQSDYSQLVQGQSIGNYGIEELFGGGDFWITLKGGRVHQIVTDTQIDSLTFIGQDAGPLKLDNLSGDVSLSRDQNDAWEVVMANMAVRYKEHFWRPFNLYALFLPDVSFSARADSIDLALVSELVASSGYLNADVQSRIEQYAPNGFLENFSFHAPLQEIAEQNLFLKSNLVGLELGSFKGSPTMWGINGYLQLDYDSSRNQIEGVTEVESDEFSINIPSVFTEVWDYTFVNGKLDFRVDLSNGQEVTLASNAIVAESEVVDGRIQFTSTVHEFPDGERDAELELLVGVERVDAAQKSLYLPDGPNITGNLRRSMEWLDEAVIDGEVYNSGVIFRGSTIRGSNPITKTFQSFYLLRNGELNFSNDWPHLDALSGYIVTDDSKIDIEVTSGSSLGIEIDRVQGEIRRNELDENWLEVSGRVIGQTLNGLEYMQQAPVGDSLKTTFAKWQVAGDFSAGVSVRVPLESPDKNTAVRLDIALDDNSISIPEYELEVNQLSGPVVFETSMGLELSQLTGQLFGQPAEIVLSSQSTNGEIETILVNAEGSASTEALTAWPLQTEFVRDLLARAEGEIDFLAKLTVDQSADRVNRNRLIIDSDLAGASISLPPPFAKAVASNYPLHVEIEFGEQQSVSGSYGSDLVFDLNLMNGTIGDGLVYVGAQGSDGANLFATETDGLAIVGELDRFAVNEWTDFFSGLSSIENSTEGFADNVAFVDIMVDSMELYEEEFTDVAIRIEPDSVNQGWLTKLSSESIQGGVTIPYLAEDYLQIDLEYLRLQRQGAEKAVDERDADLGEERVDSLVMIDPRNLPRMRFATDDFSIGPRTYGSWQFRLDPTVTGAEFSDLVFDFRGLRAGLDEPPPVDEETGEMITRFLPYFSWDYDGEKHLSGLRGILYADDIADVLTANGYAPSLNSDNAYFITNVTWPGTPAFFSASNLSGDIELEIFEGRFQQNSGSTGALKLISIINFDAIMRRLRLSDDLLRSGLAYDEITALVKLDNGLVNFEDRLVISGPSSLYQVTGEIDLAEETILGEMFVTLPVSDNIPWVGLVTGNLPLAVGAYLFDRIFGAQVDSLTSAVYTLEGPWEGLQPQFKQAFGSPESAEQRDAGIQ